MPAALFFHDCIQLIGFADYKATEVAVKELCEKFGLVPMQNYKLV